MRGFLEQYMIQLICEIGQRRSHLGAPLGSFVLLRRLSRHHNMIFKFI